MTRTERSILIASGTRELKLCRNLKLINISNPRYRFYVDMEKKIEKELNLLYSMDYTTQRLTSFQETYSLFNVVT
jgi:hypothetical protein